MLNHYVEIIMSKKYSYNKNKVIMPFHKILAAIILALYEGNIEKISAR